MEFRTTTHVDARPEHVWDVLARPATWPDRDLGVVAVTGPDGEVAVGQRLRIASSAAPDRAFPVRVVEVVAPRRLVLRGGMPLGLFVGTRTYTVEPEGEGSRFTMTEVYTGPLAGLVTRSIPDLQPSFDHFARGLATAATDG